MANEKRLTDFRINAEIPSIEFDCPHCGIHVTIVGCNLNAPEEWRMVECAVCCGVIELDGMSMAEERQPAIGTSYKRPWEVFSADDFCSTEKSETEGMRMAKCNTCAHFDVCEKHNATVDFDVDDGVCLHYEKQVVRCHQCIHHSQGGLPDDRVWCRKMCRYMDADEFCSRGEGE